MELTEHNALTKWAKKQFADSVKTVSVVSCTDPRAKGYALLAVTKGGLLVSVHIGPAAGAKCAISRIAKQRAFA